MAIHPRQLVLAAGSLGDSLLTLPALRQLESFGPVTVSGTSSYLSLGADLFGVSQTIPLDPLLQALHKDEPLSKNNTEFLSSFDRIFLFFKEKDQKLIEKLSKSTHGQLIFPSQSFEDFLASARWAGEYWLETVLQKPLIPGQAHPQAKLIFQSHHLEKGKELLKALRLFSPLVIHPGSGSPAKNAPLSFFQKAAQRAVEESGKQVLVIWGEAEMEWMSKIQKAFEGMKGVALLDNPLPLKDLACLLTQCSAYLGNDSGVTYLANACGLRTFAVFNSTDSRIWGPQTDIFILHWLKGNLG